MKEEEAYLEIMRRCDGKSNSHIRIIIAEAIGLFSILTLLRGMALKLYSILNITITVFLILAYIMLVFLVYHSFSRSIYWSKIADEAAENIFVQRNKETENKLGDFQKQVVEKAITRIPSIFVFISKLRKKYLNFVYCLAILALIFSVVLLVAVLSLP